MHFYTIPEGGAMRFLLLLLIIAFNAYCFKFSPMSISLEPSGAGATYSFALENTSPEKIAIEISMMGREISLDGEEVLKDAEAEFTVYPAQVIMEVGQKKTVRLSWIGDPKPKSELNFRIIAEQLPIKGLNKEKGAKAKINILLRYAGSVYITPAEARSNLVAISAEKSQKDGKSLAVVLENKGNKHQIIIDPELTIESLKNKKIIVLKKENLKSIDGQNMLSKSKRRFLVPWPGALEGEVLKVSIKIGGE